MQVKINSKTYPASSVYGRTEALAGFNRDVITMILGGTYADVSADFISGAMFTVVDDNGGEYTYDTYGVAGPITDNRDGTCTIKMGKDNTSEQDAQAAQQEAEATVVALVGAPVSDVAAARAVVEAGAATLSDGEAAKVPYMSKKWIVGEAVTANDRRYYEPTALLYKCRQAHTTQADWTPDKTPALWAVVDVEHAGTMEDPIPAARGMDYVYGKYYLDPEDGKIYLCKRIGEADGGVINLQYLPHELIWQYFEAV